MPQDPTLLSTSDWLLRQPKIGDSVVRERLGIIAVLCAALEGSTQLEGPPISLLDRLGEGLSRLPPQMEGYNRGHPLRDWLDVAALAEHHGSLSLAYLIIGRLQQLLTVGLALDNSSNDVDSRREETALCWARRGRIARVDGSLDDAEECYREAIRLGNRNPWGDGRCQGELGLTILSYFRGNMPAAAKRAQRILAQRPAVSPIYRMSAHQMFALCARRRGDLIDALLHGWHAFDLLEAKDSRRVELLITLSELALEFGNVDAARAGFAAVLAVDPPNRIRVPALAGALDAASLLLTAPLGYGDYTDESFEAAWQSLQGAVTRDPLPPYVEVPAIISLVRAALRAQRWAEAERWLARGGALANANGFHEKRFVLEQLTADLDSARGLEARRSAVDEVETKSEIRTVTQRKTPERDLAQAFSRFAHVRLG